MEKPNTETIFKNNQQHAVKSAGTENEARIKRLYGNSSIGYGRQILFYTSLNFFNIAAGYVCKIRLV